MKSFYSNTNIMTCLRPQVSKVLRSHKYYGLFKATYIKSLPFFVKFVSQTRTILFWNGRKITYLHTTRIQILLYIYIYILLGKSIKLTYNLHILCCCMYYIYIIYMYFVCRVWMSNDISIPPDIHPANNYSTTGPPFKKPPY